MEEIMFDVYEGLNVCSMDGKCEECPYHNCKDMKCIDALMYDAMSILEEVMATMGLIEETKDEEKTEEKTEEKKE